MALRHSTYDSLGRQRWPRAFTPLPTRLRNPTRSFGLRQRSFRLVPTYFRLDYAFLPTRFRFSFRLAFRPTSLSFPTPITHVSTSFRLSSDLVAAVLRLDYSPFPTSTRIGSESLKELPTWSPTFVRLASIRITLTFRFVHLRLSRSYTFRLPTLFPIHSSAPPISDSVQTLILRFRFG